MSVRLSFAIAIALATFPRAQSPEVLAATELAANLVVPVHTLADDSIGGAYGVWAAGPGYKTSFHDGFAFYPVLGPAAPCHLPLHWRTEAVTIGGEAWPLPEAKTSWSGCRCERIAGDLVETYDVRTEGVEQTFTLLRRPALHGDLVITGAVTTPLACAPVTAAQQALVFGNADGPVIRYGMATAFDATGRQAAVLTSWDGSRIRLTLGAAFLAEAAWPVVVDPLIVPTQLASGLPAQVPTSLMVPAITARPEANGRMVVAWTRQVTSADHDLYALVVARDFQSGTWLFTDLQAGWSSLDADATYVSSGQKFIVTQRRQFTVASNHLRVYLHDVANTTVNSGTVIGQNAPSGYEDLGPVIGGSRNGGLALVVCNRLHTASGVQGVVGVRIDALAGTLAASLTFTGGFLETLGSAQITPMTLGTGGWIVGMVGSSGIRIARVSNTGSGTVATHLLLPYTTSVFTDPWRPVFKVAGTEGRYLIVHGVRSLVGTPALLIDSALSTRFDWPATAANPTLMPTRTLQIGSVALGSPFTWQLGGIEHDLLTRSHWAVSYKHYQQPTARLLRFGNGGSPVETVTTNGLCDVAFALDGADGSFPVAYHAGTTLSGSDLEYPADAISVPYGSSCAGASVSATSNRPFAGHQYLRINLLNATPSALCILALSFTPGSMDLTPHGMPGCILNVGLPLLGTLTAVANPGGDAQVILALPDTPLLTGDLHSQWLYIDPTAAPVPLRSWRGLRHQIR